jgi:hypothetical protein
MEEDRGIRAELRVVVEVAHDEAIGVRTANERYARAPTHQTPFTVTTDCQLRFDHVTAALVVHAFDLDVLTRIFQPCHLAFPAQCAWLDRLQVGLEQPFGLVLRKDENERESRAARSQTQFTDPAPIIVGYASRDLNTSCQQFIREAETRKQIEGDRVNTDRARVTGYGLPLFQDAAFDAKMAETRSEEQPDGPATDDRDRKHVQQAEGSFFRP